MKRSQILLCTGLVLISGISLIAAPIQDRRPDTGSKPQDQHKHDHQHDHAPAAGDAAAEHAGFTHLKALVGDWVASGSHGDVVMADVPVNYRLTAGGSVVMETLFIGTDHEMVTMYSMDGDDLVLTHYCAMGNQPHMRAQSPKSADASTVSFVCDGKGGNMKETDPHMHAATFTFISSDHFKCAWAMHADGKPHDEAKFEMKRKKA